MHALSKPIGIKLPSHDRERLKKLAEQKKRSARWLAKEAITQFLDREETAKTSDRKRLPHGKSTARQGNRSPMKTS